MVILDALSKIPPVGYIILLLVFAATVAFLGSLSGVGGGVLHIPVMVWVLTIPVKEIKFISTVLVFASALLNTIMAMIKKKQNYWILLVSFIVATPTVFLGNFINDKINDGITELIIVILLSYVSIQLLINQYVLKKRNIEQQIQHQRWYHIKLGNTDKYVNIFFLAIVTFITAMITSLTGMGGGVILMPFLLLVIKLSIKESAPISHSIIMITSFLTIIIESTMGEHNYFEHTGAMTNILTPMLVGAIAGTVGAIFVKKYIKKEVIILWILVILIWISIIKMVVELAQNGI